ncbi:MAG: hypothetical protein II851_07650 [Bacteroidales bacterium]|nr:hypothetical protein [Bacteroidales bacterium]
MQASSRTFPIRLLTCLAILVLAVGCGKFKEIEVTSFQVESFSPNGMRAVDAVALVGVHNPTVGFTISDLKGTVRDGENEIAYLEGAPVTVEKKSDKEYVLPCTVTLSENLSLFQILSLLKNMDFEGCVVDLSALVTLNNGLKKTLVYNDIPVKDLMEKGRSAETFKL